MPRRFHQAAVGLLLLFTLTSCNESAPLTAPPPPPPPPGPVTITGLRIVVPSTIAPGESVQLTANLIKSDGSSENITSQAQWTSSSPAVQVSSTGLATGQDIGNAILRASFGERYASERIIVVPKNTFRLAGNIRDGDFTVGNATLTVISGVGQGLTTRSAASGGSFELLGVAGRIQIRVQKDGYPDHIEQLDITAHRDHTFYIGGGVPRTNYIGTYSLTISAASSCPSTFPDAAKRRTYTANIEPYWSNAPGHMVLKMSGGDLLYSHTRTSTVWLIRAVAS